MLLVLTNEVAIQDGKEAFSFIDTLIAAIPVFVTLKIGIEVVWLKGVKFPVSDVAFILNLVLGGREIEALITSICRFKEEIADV